MILYFLILVILAYIGSNNLSSNKNTTFSSLFVVYFIITLTWGFVYIDAPDTPGYIQYFNIFAKDWINDGIVLPKYNNFEPGFESLSCILRTISPEYYIFQFTLFSLEVALIMLGLVKLFNKQNALVLICAIAIVLPFNLLSALRQGVAISIIIFSIQFILKKDLIKYIITIIIASLFHTSALFLIPLYFINRLFKVLNKPLVLVSILVLLDFCYLTGINLSNLINQVLAVTGNSIDGLSFYEIYKDNDETAITNFGVMKFIEMNVIYVLLFFINKSKDNAISIAKLFFLIYIAVNCLLGGIVAHRITYYFVIFYYISMVIAFTSTTKQFLKSETIGYLSACLYISILFLFYFGANSEEHLSNMILNNVN